MNLLIIIFFLLFRLYIFDQLYSINETIDLTSYRIFSIDSKLKLFTPNNVYTINTDSASEVMILDSEIKPISGLNKFSSEFIEYHSNNQTYYLISMILINDSYNIIMIDSKGIVKNSLKLCEISEINENYEKKNIYQLNPNNFFITYLNNNDETIIKYFSINDNLEIELDSESIIQEKDINFISTGIQKLNEVNSSLGLYLENDIIHAILDHQGNEHNEIKDMVIIDNLNNLKSIDFVKGESISISGLVENQEIILAYLSNDNVLKIASYNLYYLVLTGDLNFHSNSEKEIFEINNVNTINGIYNINNEIYAVIYDDNNIKYINSNLNEEILPTKTSYFNNNNEFIASSSDNYGLIVNYKSNNNLYICLSLIDDPKNGETSENNSNNKSNNSNNNSNDSNKSQNSNNSQNSKDNNNKSSNSKTNQVENFESSSSSSIYSIISSSFTSSSFYHSLSSSSNCFSSSSSSIYDIKSSFSSFSSSSFYSSKSSSSFIENSSSSSSSLLLSSSLESSFSSSSSSSSYTSLSSSYIISSSSSSSFLNSESISSISSSSSYSNNIKSSSSSSSSNILEISSSSSSHLDSSFLSSDSSFSSNNNDNSLSSSSSYYSSSSISSNYINDNENSQQKSNSNSEFNSKSGNNNNEDSASSSHFECSDFSIIIDNKCVNLFDHMKIIINPLKILENNLNNTQNNNSNTSINNNSSNNSNEDPSKISTNFDKNYNLTTIEIYLDSITSSQIISNIDSITNVALYILSNFETASTKINVSNLNFNGIDAIHMFTDNNKNTLNRISLDYSFYLYDSNSNSLPPNATKISLLYCEKILKEKYNLSKLYISQIEYYYSSNKSILNTEYAVYSKSGKQLNLSYCKENNSLIQMEYSLDIFNFILWENYPLYRIIREQYNNLDSLEANESFYNDICYSFSSINNNRDMTLKDRRNNYYEDLTLCEENCNYIGINTTFNRSVCLCEVKTEINSSRILKKDFVDIFTNFKEALPSTNLKIIKCSKVLWETSCIKKNTGFYIQIIIFFVILLMIFLYYYKSIKIIREKVSKLLADRQNNKSVYFSNKTNLPNILKNLENNNNTIGKSLKNNNNNNPNILIMSDKSSKIIKNLDNSNSKASNLNNSSNYHILDNLKNLDDSKNIIIQNLHLLDNTQETVINKAQNINNDSSLIKEEINSKNKENIINKNTIKLYNNNSNNKELMNKRKSYLPKLKNILTEKFKKDNKLSITLYNLLKDYWRILKTHHSLINLIVYPPKYNRTNMKLAYILSSISLNLTLNAMLYTQDTISKNYYYKKSINTISYVITKQILKSLYCFIITVIVDMPINYLCMGYNELERMTNENNKKKYKNIQYIKKMDSGQKKFILYCFLIVILELFYIYYITLFCCIYQNSQYNWLEGAIVSILLGYLGAFFSSLALVFLNIVRKKTKKKWLKDKLDKIIE